MRLATELSDEAIQDKGELVRNDLSFPYWDKPNVRVTPQMCSQAPTKQSQPPTACAGFSTRRWALLALLSDDGMSLRFCMHQV